MKSNEPNEQAIAINKAMVLGYLLRSTKPEFSVGTQTLADVLKISPIEVNASLMALATEERIKLTISRAVVQLGGADD
jgi:hypothetical protein